MDGQWVCGGPNSYVITSEGEVIKLTKRGWAERVLFPSIIAALDGISIKPYYHYVTSTYAKSSFEERLHHIDGLEKGETGVTAATRILHRCTVTADPK